MKRRTFLKTTAKIAGWGLGAGLVGLGGAIVWVQPRRRVLPPQSPDDASRPIEAKVRKRVVVVGGGLAGLVTAIELAARKLDVTLLERASHLGGKLGGWQVNALGESWPVEHGFHGFFSQYYNLKEVLDAAGASDGDFVDPGAYPVAFADRPTEVFGAGTTRIFPFNLLSVVRKSPSMKLGAFRHDGPAIYDLMKWNGERTFERFDGTDFASFARDGRINRPMVETVLEPFGKTTLNRVGRLSAAEAIRFFHFYFMGNPEGLGYRFTTRDSMAAVIEPLRRRLEALGGRVRLATPVRRLVMDGGRVAGVELEGTAARRAPVTLAEATVPASGWLKLDGSDGAPLYVGRRQGRVVAFDGRCTHMGCPVAPDAATGGFACPCHGGRFDASGAPTAGPPQRPLDALPVVAAGAGQIAVGGGAEPARETIPLDYVVVACEVRGVKAVLGASDHCASPELARRVSSLGEAEPYVVYRIWLDRPVRDAKATFFTCARFRYLDSLAVYSNLQEPYIGWARRTGGSVVELHAYAIAPEDQASADVIAAALRDEMLRVLPELAGAKVLHAEYQQQSNFSRWAPGDHALRPTTETPIANLFLAGDHVHLPVAVALMEGATMSGRFAANAILRREGLREIPIPTVAEKGPLA
jgi:isorenieratene synthase